MNPHPINNPNQNDDSDTNSSTGSSHPLISSGSSQSHLTHPELLRRRLHNVRRLSRYYRDMYWRLLMNQLRFLLRLYISETAFQEDQERPNNINAVTQNYNYNHKCAFPGCHKKSMPITTFCFAHILSDPRQVLYKPCQFVISSAQSGGGDIIRCRKPIYRLTVPSYCDGHMQPLIVMSNEEEKEDGAASPSPDRGMNNINK